MNPKLDKDMKEMSILKQEYTKIKERVEAIDLLLDDMNMNNDNLGTSIMTYEKEIEKLENDKDGHKPLQKLQDLLDKWSKEDIKTDDDLANFACELWQTVEEFEKELKESMKGHEIIMHMKQYKYQSHVDWIKNKFGFQIELYEQTFNEIKLKYNKEIDRLNITIADMESKAMNFARSEDYIAQLANSETRLKNLPDAGKQVDELKNVLK